MECYFCTIFTERWYQEFPTASVQGAKRRASMEGADNFEFVGEEGSEIRFFLKRPSRTGKWKEVSEREFTEALG